jgi:hypothetical protein
MSDAVLPTVAGYGDGTRASDAVRLQQYAVWLEERYSEVRVLQAENNRLRAGLRNYRQKHPCSHEVMCWADKVAPKAIG